MNLLTGWNDKKSMDISPSVSEQSFPRYWVAEGERRKLKHSSAIGRSPEFLANGRV